MNFKNLARLIDGINSIGTQKDAITINKGDNMKTDQEIYEFCKAHYYTSENVLWEPFENWPVEDVEEAIQCDVNTLKTFLNI